MTSTVYLPGISFHTREYGLCAGAIGGGGGLILRTTDSGVQWSTCLTTSGQFKDVRYSSASNAVAIAVDGIWRTTDTGTTWNRVDSSSHGDGYLRFANERVGLYFDLSKNTGDTLKLLKTTDGGGTWAYVRFSMTFSGPMGFAFPDTNHIMIAGYAGFNPGMLPGQVCQTGDGGKTWYSTYTTSMLWDIASPDPYHAFAVGDSGYIAGVSRDCRLPGDAPLTPPDGDDNVSLFGYAVQNSTLKLGWNTPVPVTVGSIQLQWSTSSVFRSEFTEDTTVVPACWNLISWLPAGPLMPMTSYFWRMRYHYTAGTVSPWFGPWSFMTAGSIVSGLVFDDRNRDGIRQDGEAGVPGAYIELEGKSSGRVITDATGRYRIAYSDAGSYLLKVYPPPVWRLTVPESGMRDLLLSRGDSVSGADFGIVYPWNVVSGSVFNDLNENGVRDSAEPGLGGWIVRSTGVRTSSTVTDSAGGYAIGEIGIGLDTLFIDHQPGWEAVVPTFPEAYEIYFDSLNHTASAMNFAMKPVPANRVKICITYEATGISASKILMFGTRIGATDGIYGVFPGASIIDFSEGEFELPTFERIFFDARFTGDSALYGEGSWTDMRRWQSAAQIDTYRVFFTPGSLDGGSYPVSFSWDSALVRRSYSGDVALADRFNNHWDMKLTDRCVIADPMVGWLRLSASGPLVTRTDNVAPHEAAVPSAFTLDQNYPNPFNPATTISFTIPRTGMVVLRITDLLGRTAAVPVDAVMPAGRHSLIWQAAGFPGGVYFCDLRWESRRLAGKMLLIR